MNLNRTRRAAAVMAVLLGGLAAPIAVGPLAGVASAATSPAISYNGIVLSGSGFTPGNKALVQVMEGTTLFASTTVPTTWPRLVCTHPIPGEPRDCEETGGGAISASPGSPMAYLPCGYTASGTVSATDLTTGSVASTPYTWVGMC